MIQNHIYAINSLLFLPLQVRPSSQGFISARPMELRGLKLSKYSYRVKARRMLRYLRGAASIAITKSFASKQKLQMDMSLLMKRSRCLLSLLLHRHHRSDQMLALGAMPRVYHEYEFSCSNSPNLLFHHAKRRCSCFPCLHLVVDEEPEEHILRPPAEVVQAKIIRSPLDEYLAAGQRRRRSYSPTSSPFSAGRFSDYSSGDDKDGGSSGLSLSQEVDDEAEEFIRRFYKELREQSKMAALLQKQNN